MSEQADTAGRSDAGGGQTATARLVVPEMDCPSCAETIETSVGRVDGVTDVRPRVTDGTVAVTYDSARATEREIRRAIEGAGYEVVDGSDDAERGDEPTMAPPATVWRSSRAKKTWIGAVFVALGLLFEFALTDPNVAVASVLGRPIRVADVLFLGAVAAGGAPVVRGGYYSARNRSLDIDLLMSVAILAATGIGYFVEAATLAVLFGVAELLEDYAMDRARDSLRELVALSPEEATVRRDGAEVTVPADEVAVGETVVIRPGERIPLDGTIVEGESAVDESPITGESVPVEKAVGDAVYAGSIVEGGYVEIEVTAPASESTLSRVVELVRGAEEAKTERERFVDRFASYYTPAVVVLAVLTAALPPLLVDGSATVAVAGVAHTFGGGWRTWFVRGLTLLVVACPCAFVISTPVAVVSGVTSAAKHGVLVKGGTHLESMGEVNALAVDKTGTLTRGELAVTDVVPFGAASSDAVLRYASAIERRSEHPIAAAIVSHAGDAGVDDLPAVEAFESVTGRGVRAVVDGDTYRVGSPSLFGLSDDEAGATHSQSDGGTEGVGSAALSTEITDTIERLEGEGKTVILVGTDATVLGAVAVADEVRSGAERAIARLHDFGVTRVVMLTGDNEGTARAIAERVGVDEYRAELLPEEKVDAVESLRRGGGVAMVGDGVNDAPALAAATSGSRWAPLGPTPRWRRRTSR